VSEKDIMHRIMIALTGAGARVFRNQVGLAYQGQAERFTRRAQVRVGPGDILLRRARTLRVGLPAGSSDLVGWRSRTIDEYDIGKTIAQFVACETKSATGELEPEQRIFLEVVRDSGGIAIVARDHDDAIAKLNNGGGIS
jgi:hypothetical protein